MIESPCYGCDRRTDVCHDTCEAYNLWVDTIREKKAKHYGLKTAGALLHDGARKAVRKRNGRKD